MLEGIDGPATPSIVGGQEEHRLEFQVAVERLREGNGQHGIGLRIAEEPLIASFGQLRQGRHAGDQRNLALFRQRHDRLGGAAAESPHDDRSEEHTSELQSLMRISYAVFCLKKKNTKKNNNKTSVST